MTNVSLCIYKDDLDPSAVSKRLRLEATESFRRGEPIVTKRRRYADHPIGGWLLSSRDHVQSDELEHHLIWLLDKIDASRGTLPTLLAEGYDVALILVMSGNPTGGGPTIAASTLARVANLKVPIDLDIYA